MNNWLREKSSAVEQDEAYIQPGSSAGALDQSMRRLAALRRRERWSRRGLILFGFACLVIGFVILPPLGLAGAGLIFVPVGGFLMFWGVLRQVQSFLAEH
jgi:peptidoglycan/LPS O-acetylase OafA/YrhL